MALSQRAINEYKAIYKKVFGKEITGVEANEQGSKLISLFKTIAKPVPGNWEDEIVKKYAKKSKNI